MKIIKLHSYGIKKILDLTVWTLQKTQSLDMLNVKVYSTAKDTS